MTRYFYTDPLAAAWMAKHFGMKICCRHDDAEMADYELPEEQREYPFGHAMIDDGCTAEMWGDIIHESLGRRAYIHHDSLHLLEPQPGDFGWDAENSFFACYPDGCFCLSPIGDRAVAPVRIIQRNGKAFHWPEGEVA